MTVTLMEWVQTETAAQLRVITQQATPLKLQLQRFKLVDRRLLILADHLQTIIGLVQSFHLRVRGRKVLSTAVKTGTQKTTRAVFAPFVELQFKGAL